MRVLNVLSIDWDFFVDATGDFRAIHFPDIPNERYPKQLQNIIWINRYSDDDRLLKIGYNTNASKLVSAIGRVPFVVVAESHRWIHPYVVRKMEELNSKKINLLNIDYHSDYRDDTDELDCGNWLSILMSQYKGTYRWLGWRDSYLGKIPKRLKFCTDWGTGLSEVANTRWDVVFVCRSDMWSPPHLDKSFTNVFKPLIDRCYSEVQHGVMDSRYDDVFQSQILKMREAMGTTRKGW